MLGWDLGGAHLKAARVENGRVTDAVQIPCPLWQGLPHLDAAMTKALSRLGPSRRHAVTMTGEMADIFPSREEGVRALTAILPVSGLSLIFSRREGIRMPAGTWSGLTRPIARRTGTNHRCLCGWEWK